MANQIKKSKPTSLEEDLELGFLEKVYIKDRAFKHY
jgi:hypothetical protein